MSQKVELKVIKNQKNNFMPRNKRINDPIAELKDVMKKLLILKLFDMGVSQPEIAKKLHMDLNAVNNFLKGVKKQK